MTDYAKIPDASSQLVKDQMLIQKVADNASHHLSTPQRVIDPSDQLSY